MTTSHGVFQFIGGDDWEIAATLLDETGAPYDLTSAQVLWTLLDSNGNRVLDTGDYGISITDAVAGKCSIVVASSKTTTVPGARYNDALRIITGGITSTLSVGPIYVTSDPWHAAVQPGRLRVVA